MLKPYHLSMTTRALAGVFNPQVLDTILQANIGQDSLLNLLKSRYHFDANAFEEAFAYVRGQEAAVLEHLKIGKYTASQKAFGRFTHAVQDYYAHTNYVALWLEEHPGYTPNSGRPVDPLDERIMNSDRLHAARVYYPLEALTIFNALEPALKARLPPDSHANMNLDSPSSGPLFPLALSAAQERTRIEFGKLRDRILSVLGQNVLHDFLNRTHP